MTNNNHTPDPLEIFLVEDNPGDIRLTKEAFEALDRETVVNTVMDGDEAVDRLTNQVTNSRKSPPDLALVDLGLPGRDGCDVLKAIRNDSQLKTLPVVMLSESDMREDIERCYQAKANAYLTKPTDPKDFEALIQKFTRFWGEHAILPPAPA